MFQAVQDRSLTLLRAAILIAAGDATCSSIPAIFTWNCYRRDLRAVDLPGSSPLPLPSTLGAK